MEISRYDGRAYEALWRNTPVADRTPYIGLIGPRGSGKSEYLTGLVSHINAGHGVHTVGSDAILIDLRRLGVADERELSHRFIRQLLDFAVNLPTLRPRVKGLSGHGDLTKVLCGLLAGSERRLYVCVDSLECTPEAFARALSRHFRMYFEARREKAEYQRLGFVFAGALSYFKLKSESDSCFHLTQTIRVGAQPLEEKIDIVRARLARLGIQAVPESLIALLTDETGGEPAFFRPLIETLSGRGSPKDLILDEGSVRRFTEDCEWIASSIPVMAELCFSFFNDAELRAVVERLAAGEVFVKPARLVADIDPLELSGVVRLEEGPGATVYRFRNRLISRFFSRLIAGEGGLAGAELGILSVKALGELATEWKGTCMEASVTLEATRRRILNAGGIGEALRELQAAWAYLNGASPELTPSVAVVSDGRLWTIVKGEHGWREAGRKNTEAEEVARRVCTLRRSVVSVAERHVMIGRLVKEGGPSIVLLAEGETSLWERALDSGRLDWWIEWVEQLGRRLSLLVLSDLCRVLTKREAGEPSVPKDLGAVPPAAGSPRRSLDDLREQLLPDCEREVDRLLVVIAICTALLFAVLAYRALGWVTPLLERRWQQLEPMLVVIHVALGGVAFLLSLLGFRLDPVSVRKRLFPALVERNMARRMRRAKLQVVADTAPASDDNGRSEGSRASGDDRPR